VEKPPQLVGLDRGETVYWWATVAVDTENKSGCRLGHPSGVLLPKGGPTRCAVDDADGA
jgi:hypothetical protein